jgi:hypothetical protein
MRVIRLALPDGEGTYSAGPAASTDVAHLL